MLPATMFGLVRFITRVFQPDKRKWLSEKFKEAFGEQIVPDGTYGAKVPLRIGATINLTGNYADEQERQEAYAEKLKTYPQVQDQGDGYKSFASILLYLMMDHIRSFFIDEPEAFLHPPQAKIMGHIIGQTLSDQQQAFVSTHSEDLLKGLLEVKADRIKVIRITRDEDTNSFATLDNQQIKYIWSDPLLRYSNILSSLFYKTTVLCESESDCKMYSIIDGYLKERAGSYSEVLFIHCGGKQRLPAIAKALLALQVNLITITDLDILDYSKNDLKELAEAYGIDWKTIEPNYRVVMEPFKDQQNPITIKDLKKNGEPSIPSGDATSKYGLLKNVLVNRGIFLVPVGEIENFVKDCGKHGNQWVSEVLERHPSLADQAYDDIKKFIIGTGI